MAKTVHREPLVTGDTLQDINTTEETAAYLRMPVKTLYKLTSLGKGPKGFKSGKHRRYTRGAIIEYVEQLAQASE